MPAFLGLCIVDICDIHRWYGFLVDECCLLIYIRSIDASYMVSEKYMLPTVVWLCYAC
jgi:hypothetical protein